MAQRSLAIFCRFSGLCIAAAILGISYSASAADENQEISWELSADRLTHDQETTAITAEGDVVLKELGKEKPYGVEINADRIQYNTRSQQVDAVGNLRIQERYGEIRATKATIDLEKQTGLFNEATLFRYENNLHLSGDLLEKTGKNTYHLENGKFTSCTTEEGEAPPWSIWSNDVNAAHRMAHNLEAGYVWINGSARRVPGTPFGGYKLSGLGKESSLEEVLGFCRTKTVAVSIL